MGASRGLIARAIADDGTELILSERNGIFQIRADGFEFMSSRAPGSERALARIACLEVASRLNPRVLIGGLGMGYTLRAALDALPGDAAVVVAEVIRALVDWNHRLLGSLTGHPLQDPRVTVVIADVFALLGETGGFDAIVLDVDNGPDHLMLDSNERLYLQAGMDRVRNALKADGVVAFWCPSPDSTLVERLGRAGFAVEVSEIAPRTDRMTPRHAIVLGALGGGRQAVPGAGWVAGRPRRGGGRHGP